MKDAVDNLNVSFDSSEKDLSAIAIFKPLKNGRNKLLKMVVGEQAEILYQALTNQEVEICLKEKEDNCTDIYCENCMNNYNCIEYLEEQERMNEEDDE